MTDAAQSFGRDDHVCWAYDEPGEFHSAVCEFLAEGLTQGLRVCYVADGDTRALWDDLGDLDRTNQSAVQVRSLGERYPPGAVVEPVGRMRAVAVATEEALAAGFAGLRVAVETTSLVRTPRQLDGVARFEHLVDRYMIEQPLSVLCGFNRVELGEATIAQLASLHPFVNESTPLFRLYASAYAAASLSGELDATNDSLFTTALQHADLRPTAGELVIDASELSFIDHRSLLSLANHARRCDATTVLLGDLPSAVKLIDILDLTEVRIEAPT
jgi:anti-anti-sigma regulatory factor